VNPLYRIILYAKDVILLTEYYQTVMGLKHVFMSDDKNWSEFETGGCRLALHNGGKEYNKTRMPKIVFYTGNVIKERDKLIDNGADMGKIWEFEDIKFCNGTDPEGNIFQIFR